MLFMTKRVAGELDVIAAAGVAGRSAETVRRWVWSGRLPARRRGNKLMINRTDLERLLESSGGGKSLTLAQWLDSLEHSALKSGATARSAADLVLADRRARSEEL
jgi:excisionase family DNA binding protein